MSTNIVRTFDEQFLPLVQEQIAKAAKLAARLGTAAPVASLSALRQQDTGRVSQVTGLRITRPVYDIDLTIAPLRYDGWALCARIEHDADLGTLVHCVPGKQVPAAYREQKPTCDHCRAKRARKDTFVLQHDDGRWFCVGRQCVADFLGHNVNLRTCWSVLGTLNDDEFWGSLGGRYEPAHPTGDLTVITAALIASCGFISRKQAQIAEEKGEPCGLTTSALLSTVIAPSADADRKVAVGGQYIQEIEFARLITAAAQGYALANPTFTADLAKYWAAVPVRSDFDSNCQKIVAAEEVKQKHFGLFTAAVSSYLRHLGRTAATKFERTTSAYVGTVGKREVFVALTCTKVIDVNTDFGTLHINKLADAAGNIIVWKTTSDRLEEGRAYTGKCTVKKHDAYNGVNQTIVSRCALTQTP